MPVIAGVLALIDQRLQPRRAIDAGLHVTRPLLADLGFRIFDQPSPAALRMPPSISR